MALATYADLQAAVASWSNRTDLTAQIPDFITLAEVRISADLSSKALEKTQDATITSGVATLPDDVLEVLGLRIVGATVPDVEVTSRERIQELVQQSYSGSRTYGALVGRTVELTTSTGTLSVLAKCRIPALSSGPNWLMTNFPNAYLFGSLMEVADFVEDDAEFSRWQTRYMEAIGQANASLVYRGQMAASKVRGVR